MIPFALIMLRGEGKVENVIKEMTKMGEEALRGVCVCCVCKGDVGFGGGASVKQVDTGK